MNEPKSNPVNIELAAALRGLNDGLVLDAEVTANLKAIHENLRIDPKVFDAVREFQERMQLIMEPLSEMMNEVEERFAISTQGLEKLMANLPSAEEQEEGFRIATSILAENGWFISVWHTPLSGIQNVARMYQDGKEDEAERILIHHFNDISDKIIEEACEVAPSRAVLLRKAYAMHQKEEFDFSIPVFLAQADGLGLELLGASPYTKKTTSRKTIETKLSPALKNGIMSSYCSLVLQTLPINEDTRKLDTYRDPLNRHAVLHGLSSDYGTKVNGFRILSWLQYVVSFSELPWFGKGEAK